MKKNIFFLLVFFGVFAGTSQADELGALFHGVESLKIQRSGYVLGAKLNSGQLSLADKNHMETASEKIFKFKDKDLIIVGDKNTGRVIIIYEIFKEVSRRKVQDLVGELFLAYDSPTISAHDRLVYWAWGRNGKYSAKKYKLAREENRKLDIIATVKFNSQIKIMDDGSPDSKGDAYYIISSDPLLKFFHGSGEKISS